MKYKTIDKEVEHTIEIKKSKFITYIKKIKTVDEAEEFLKEIKAMHRKARHHVPAYVLDNFSIQKYSDDGEPAKTAGVPILNILKHEEITDVIIVVVRYFGGIKLGTGGLVRAYSQCAREIIELAGVSEFIEYEEYSFTFDYTYLGKIQNFLMNHSNYIEKEVLYLDKINISIYSLKEEFDFLKENIENICNGNMEYTKTRGAYLEFVNKELRRNNEG